MSKKKKKDFYHLIRITPMSHFYKYISVLRLIHVYQFFMFLSKFVMINFMAIKGKSLINRRNM